MKTKIFIFCIFIAFIFGLCGFNYITNVESEEKTEEVLNSENISEDVLEEEPVQKEVKKDKNTIFKNNEPDIVNILVIGEENMSEQERGRSDSIIVLSIDKNKKNVKMVSFLRDLLVDIPNHDKNRLNAAYAFGGEELLKETLKQNFDIDIDYYVKVDFSVCEKVIDSIGGIDIELTEKESEYLNTTNYISNEEYRTTVAGINHFNGNQALGYSRVRYITAINGESNDFGRTFRQRYVISQMFNTLKNCSKLTLVSLVSSYINDLDTDISYMDAVSLGYILMDFDAENLNTLRIPADGMFEDCMYNEMCVLSFKEDNLTLLKEFLAN